MNPSNDSTEYRVLITQELVRSVFVLPAHDRFVLPRVNIGFRTRLGRGFQQAIREQLGLQIFLVDLWSSDAQSNAVIFALAVCERGHDDFCEVGLEQIDDAELPVSDRNRVIALLDGKAGNPVLELGWWREASSWVQSITTQTSMFENIEQHNAGAGFSLLRFVSCDGAAYWLKATAEPNTHEFAVTRYLSSLCPDSLPAVLGTKPKWNAWLTEELSCLSSMEHLEDAGLAAVLQVAAASMARLQVATITLGSQLFALGVVDHRTSTLRQHLDELFEYLEEAMRLQTSLKAPRLGRFRLQQIKNLLYRACDKSEAINIPDTILHGDMHLGNICQKGDQVCFLDWSEAYFGQPLITLQHLLLLDLSKDSALRGNNEFRRVYLEAFSTICSPDTLYRGFLLAPVLAASSTLYGRGQWFRDARRKDPRRQARARTLARYMDQAASDPELLAALAS